ncbi:unnamed protein product [Victoria cruziana]
MCGWSRADLVTRRRCAWCGGLGGRNWSRTFHGLNGQASRQTDASGAVEMGIEPAIGAAVEPGASSPASAEVTVEVAVFRVGASEGEREAVRVGPMANGEGHGGAVDVEVEGAVCTVVGEAAGRSGAGVAGEGSAWVAAEWEEGEAVGGVGRVGDQLGELQAALVGVEVAGLAGVEGLGGGATMVRAGGQRSAALGLDMGLLRLGERD